jgi:hypothetical protein
LFNPRALNKTKDNKIGCCDICGTQWSSNCSVATAEERRNRESDAARSSGVNVSESGFNAERLEADTCEFSAVYELLQKGDQRQMMAEIFAWQPRG